MQKEHGQFCIECRKETDYEIKKRHITHWIKGKEYDFEIESAVCQNCGEEINLPGLMDSNARLIDALYRKAENLVTIDDINTLMEVYNIGKAPLSLALGFGEITITRYLQGQYPSIEYSDIIRKALSNPNYMMNLLDKNRDKIGEVAYKKSWTAAMGIQELLCSVSEKMLLTISYIFEKAEEVTPLALQKLLYYIQGLYMINFEKALFDEDCQAWEHGPVYSKVYDMFSSFKYNPIDDKRFVFFRDKSQNLSVEEKKIIDLAINTFGMYSGKTLERITHEERPWKEARSKVSGYTNIIISKESIQDYFEEMAKKFDFDSVKGMNKYIQFQLDKNRSNVKA